MLAKQGSERPTAELVVEDVTYRYGSHRYSVQALDQISQTIRSGEFVCCVGPSGCGKTTLLHLLAGFLQPTTGTIRLFGQKIHGPDATRGVVFQQPTLYPWMSVAENIGFGPKVRGLPKAERQRLVRHHLALVHLEEFADRAPYELSGGMQQRVAIARVLANDPAFLLMDEPFGSLDALTREHMQEELLNIWRETRKAVFFITHSAEEAVYLGTRLIVMSPRPGRIILEKELSFSQNIGANPREIRAGRDFISAREEVMEKVYSASVV